MKGILIIKKEADMPSAHPASMANIIPIGDSILKDAKDGDEVEVTLKGTLIDHGDGPRFISAEEVDGHPTEEMPDLNEEQDEPTHDMGPEDALMHFMENQKK